jgi:type I restriction enzyme M protein
MAKLRTRESVAEMELRFGLVVPKARIAANGDYNLSGERYRIGAVTSGLKWPLVAIGDVCVVERGASPRPINDFMTDAPDGVNWIKIGDAPVGSKYITSTKERVTPEGAAKSRRVRSGDFLLSNSMSFGRPYIMAADGCIHDGWLLLRDQSKNLDKDYLYNILGSDLVFAQFKQAATGGVVNNLNSELVRGVKIPLPPLEVQREIVGEIEGYQRVIDGARAVLDNYRPHIPIDPEWPVVAIREIAAEIKAGFASGKSGVDTVGVPHIRPMNINEAGDFTLDGLKSISEEEFHGKEDYILAPGDVIFNNTNSKELVGKTCFIDRNIRGGFSNHMTRIRTLADRCDPRFLAVSLHAAWRREAFLELANKWVGQAGINAKALGEFKIPLPPLEIQQAIVAEIEAEQRLVAANRELVERFEAKIQATLARVWGEDEAAVNEARNG